jgi:D-glycero-alpha-D-manno-heptose-7-phosphate kinase
MRQDDLYKVEIVSQAPVRISFAGGGTDVSPYPELYGGAVVNTTISIFMSVRIRIRKDQQVVIYANTRPDPITYHDVSQLKYDGTLDFIKAAAKLTYKRPEGFEVYLYSPLPMCSGLGGSGAMCVALLDAFNQIGSRRLNNYDIAELAFQIETQELGNATGRQDQYAAAFGGFNHIEFLGNTHVRLNRLEIPRAGERLLNQALALIRLGERMPSGQIIQEQSAGVKNSTDTLDAMNKSKGMVTDMCEALMAADVERIGGLLDILWQEKKRFSPHVSNANIDGIFARLRAAGMLGGKLTGAGGGGHILACIDIERRDSVLTAAEHMGLQVIPFTFVHEGVMSWQSMLRTAGEGGPGAPGI